MKRVTTIRWTMVSSLALIASALAAEVAPIDITAPPQKDEYTVLLLHLDRGEGAIAKDESGKGNDGTISGATWHDGQFGKALKFDGIDDYVTCGGERHRPPHFDFGASTDFTIEFWVYTDSTVRGAPLITKKLKGSADDPGFFIHLDHGQARALIADGINQVTLSNPATVSDSKWHHIALVAKRKEHATLYVDGVAGPSENVSHLKDITNTNRELRIMDRDHDAGTNGIIDEIRISKVARSMPGAAGEPQPGPTMPPAAGGK